VEPDADVTQPRRFGLELADRKIVDSGMVSSTGTLPENSWRDETE
jgi:hypothetical protein